MKERREIKKRRLKREKNDRGGDDGMAKERGDVKGIVE